MQKLDLEGTICGYNKKILTVIILLIFVSGIMFYIGAKYEKRKLLSLGFTKCETKIKSEKRIKNKKQNTETTPTAIATPASENNRPETKPLTSPDTEIDLLKKL